MKYQLLLVMLISTLVLIPFVFAEEECKNDLTVYIQFKAFDGENLQKISTYQTPNYREDDLLSLWKIIVLNEGTCSSPEALLKLNLTNDKESIDHFFCEHQIFIPSIEPGDSYYISRDGFEERNLNGKQTVQLPFYLDSNGKNFTSCLITMLTTGLWEGKLSLEAVNPSENLGSWGSSMLTDENNAEHLRFKVRSKEEILSLEYQRNSLYIVIIIGILTILVSLVSIIIMYKIGKKQILKMDEQYEKQIRKEDEREEGKQLDLLRTLFTELTFLEKNLNSYKDTFSKKGHYPFYELWDIDAALYLRELNHKIKVKETIGLKEDLMTLKDKLLIINNMKLESKRDEEERGKEKLIQIKIESIRKGIVEIIDSDILPILIKSKKFIKKLGI